MHLTTGCRNENYHINDSKFSSSHSEKVFSYTWLLSNLLDQSGHQKHHTTRPIEILLDTGFGLPLNFEHCATRFVLTDDVIVSGFR
jgi:hypothetical protein